MAVFVRLKPSIGSSLAILQPTDLSIGLYVVYPNTNNQIEKDSCLMTRFLYLWLPEPYNTITAKLAVASVYGSDANGSSVYNFYCKPTCIDV